jgi:fructose-1,6-bisphosphatase/inositol monophosphatase family enzyme
MPDEPLAVATAVPRSVVADDELLAAAIDIAGRAADLAARRYTEGSPVALKPDRSEVTAADVEVERLIRTLVQDRGPPFVS